MPGVFSFRCAARPALAMVLLCSACGSSDARQPIAEVSVVEPVPLTEILQGDRGLWCDDSTAPKRRVEELLARMSLEQKLHEMSGARLESFDGLYLAGGDDALGIPEFKMADGPRGVRVGNATAFPVGIARGATWDPSLEKRVGEAIGLEASARGVNVLLAPTVNLLRHPAWGRSQETYSEDSFLMGEMGVAFVAGAQNHVMASVKHFAANSIENTRFSVSANLSERTLREVYLPHFEKIVRVARVGSVMSAYNRVNGTYCGENAHLLRDILKGEWGFTGFVESDWIAGTRSTVAAARAGLDIEMPVGVYYAEPLATAVAAGEVPESVIDEAVRRILLRKFCFGLDVVEAPSASVVESDEHRALAAEVAEKSAVLLKNDEHLLPLSPDGDESIVVVGALADVANLGDRGSSSVTPSTVVTPFAGISARAPGRVTLIGTDTPSDAELDAIAAADVAIVVTGLTYAEEGEYIPIAEEGNRGGDRSDLDLPAHALELIHAVSGRARKTLVILEGGGSVVVRPFVDDIDALLLAWYPGMEGGTALGRLVFGDVSPSGKLPVSFPRAMSDLPPWDFTSTEVEYGYLHGYRYLGADAAEFPFGFGLTYSRFALTGLPLESTTADSSSTVRVSVDVTNIGSRSADEVVQVYASVPHSAYERAPRDLRAFRRVTLAPGKTKRVHLDVQVKDLAVYDESFSTFTVELTKYVLEVGTSSGSLPIVYEFSVDGP